MSTPSAVPSSWPRISATLTSDGAGELVINGSSTAVQGATVEDARAQVSTLISQTAAKLARPVRASVTDPHGQWALLIHPNGRVEEDPDAPRKRNRANKRSISTSTLSSPPRQAEPQGTVTQAPATSPAMPPSRPHATASHSEYTHPAERQGGRAVDLSSQSTDAPAPPEPAPFWEQDQSASAADEPTWTAQLEPAEAPQPAPAPEDPEWAARAALPAEEGARGRFNSLLGAKIAPAPAELAHRRVTLDQEREQRAREQADAEAAAANEGRRAAREREAAEAFRRLRAIIQTNFEQTRTILVANPKGGARKTTTASLLAAVFGIFRGGYVCAWDANETMGTLGERSLTGTHTRTVVDLLEAAGRLDSIRVGDLDSYVRPQGDSHFDVLASDEDPERQDIVDGAGFATIHDILERFYRLIIVDTGNNIRTSHFRAALDTADQLVIPVSAAEDSANAAEKMMRSLRASGHRRLVDEAVVLIHDLEPQNSDPAYFDVARTIAARFEGQVSAVLPIPYDSALKDGKQIDYAQLTDKTQHAYHQAAGAIAQNLAGTTDSESLTQLREAL